MVLETFDHLQRLSGENRADYLGISTGYGDLDRTITGLNKSDLILVAARPGMGKTAFTRGLARGLGCTGRVTSPTFTIVNEYSGTVPLFHFDMYRLGSSDELFDIGWEDYLIRGGVCAVEWSERVTDALPEDTLWVDIARGSGENDRIITITGGETR